LAAPDSLPQPLAAHAEKSAAPANASAITTAAAPSQPAPASIAAPAPAAGVAPAAVPATPSALAATIVALHQAGQNNTTLLLDPPGLGHLAVHVALGAAGQVNVLFVPTTAQTAQLLHTGMDGLRQAMTTAGLSLGQAQIGGQAGGQSGQNAPGRQTPNYAAPASATPAAAEPAKGLSAYA
jgi:flagellar hook-length control protein FliK